MSPSHPDFRAMTRREIEDYLVERAMTDADFRRRLLASPEGVLRELGVPVAPEVKVRVIEEEPRSFYIILPRVLGELGDGDLESVSGGRSGAESFFGGYV